jgi:large subunit ribosomal protein L24
MKSIKPRKQRKELFNAPLHKKRKEIAAHLEENLLLKYDTRSLSVIKGDNVLVMRGSFRGHEDKVAKVNVKKRTLEIEGITMPKADGNKIAKPINPSNVLITKLNLTDKWRRKKLERGLSEETKKEIEKEAKEQIKEVEEEKKKVEAEAKALEEAEKLKEETEEDDEIEEESKEEKIDEKSVEKPKPKTEDKKPAAAKAKPKEPAAKKPAEKKETPAKKTTTPKKTPTKTTEKKEESK